jgi:hypothetical protein
LNDGAPVGEATNKRAAKDEVEVLAPCPIVLEVVNLKSEVRWHENGLDGAQVNADDLGLWMSVGVINGPNAGTGAHVQDSTGAVIFGAQGQAIVEGKEVEGVQDIEAVALELHR